MEIRIQSIKFDADKKLLDFINKKVEKLPKFHDGITAAEVSLSLTNDPQNKNVKIRAVIPGNDIVVERKADSFETALNDCVDIVKEQLKKRKEQLNG